METRSQTKKMRLLGQESNGMGLRKNDWHNLPYPAIHLIAKVGLQIDKYFAHTIIWPILNASLSL